MAVKKTAKKSPAKVKTGESYKCGICGYRIIVDEACGCAEEHVFVCCEKPMKKTAAKKTTKKKAVTKKPARKSAAKKATKKK